MDQNANQPVRPVEPTPTTNVMPPRKPKGWMITSIILIIVVIAMAAFGYYKWKQYRTLTGQLGAQISALQAQVAELESQLAATQSKSSNSSQYLKITQWGVELIPGSSLTDLQYSLKTNDMAQFQSATLNQKMNTNATSTTACGAGSLGVISRGKAGQEFTSTTFDKATGAVKVGDYYYVYQQPGSGCGGSNANQSLLQAGYTEMTNSMKTLKAIQ